MTISHPSIHIAYGSESGNAQTLAQQIKKQLQAYQPTLCTLNDLVINNLGSQDVLLIISSNFGDGEPPGNAVVFYEKLLEQSNQLACQYAIFGLGDVSYDKFCGFTINLDEKLHELGATPIAKRVDADTHYQDFYQRWSQALLSYFQGEKQLLQQLDLKVKAYNEKTSFTASIASTQRINQGEFPVYDIYIDITASGMNYQAGDLLYIIPPVNQPTFQRIVAFYEQENLLTDEQKALLSTKEIRTLGKPLIRAVAKQTKNSELKILTKMSASKQLADYVYGRDVADLLSDYCTPSTMPIKELLNILSTTLPRAYSIASCGTTSPKQIRLCVREVSYQLNEKNYIGSGSHFLCHAEAGTEVQVYVRANEHFHLPTDSKKPIIMIGAGTGIAPYIAFLSSHLLQSEKNQHSTKNERRMTHLFFGERYRSSDFLYQEELQSYLDTGKLTTLNTAFSRDQKQKVYVQDALVTQGKNIWQLLTDGAEVYVCGSKANLSKSIDTAFSQIAQQYGDYNEEQAKELIQTLVNEGRYHRDLY